MVSDREGEVRTDVSGDICIKRGDVGPGLRAVAAPGSERGHPQNTWWASRRIPRCVCQGAWLRRMEKGRARPEEQVEEAWKGVGGGREDDGEGDGEEGGRREEDEKVAFGFGFRCLGGR